MITDNLTAMSRIPKRPKPYVGQQIELQRQRLGRKSGTTIEQETDGVIYQKLLQRVENGDKPLDSLTPRQLHALASALDWSVLQLQEATGIDLGAAIPQGWVRAGESLEETLQREKDGGIIPATDIPLNIPDALQQAINEHGDRYPELHNEATLRALVAPGVLAGHTDGPQTADQWVEYFLVNRRWLPK